MKIIQSGYRIKSRLTGLEILQDIESVGRTCYKSEDKITEESSTEFVKKLIASGHEAMIEHNSITVRVVCDRGVSHEIVRHRLASYGQESTRYCNYSKEKFGSEINVIDIRKAMALDTKMKDLSVHLINEIFNEWCAAMEDAERHYNRMIQLGATPQIARGVLPTDLKTEIVITMNVREWRHFFTLRTPVAAHPKMREITIPLLGEMKQFVPVVFDDIEIPVLPDNVNTAE